MELTEGIILYAPNGDCFTVTAVSGDSVTLRYEHSSFKRPVSFVLSHLSDRDPTAKYVSSGEDGKKDAVFCLEEEHLAETLHELESFDGFLTGVDLDDGGRIVNAHYDFDETSKEAIIASPYFARMDMDVDSSENGLEQFSVYVGKKGVYHNDKLLICDWRSEIGQRYYIKSEINFKYNSFDYTLKLRRGLDIRRSRLWEYHDEYLVGKIGADSASQITDPFLLRVISEKRRQGQLTDIIASIQENQNNIITAPEDRSLIVQGCAGSGKTMILLHRLSFIKFNNRALDVDKVRILTPNSLFNMHINDLSRSLELDKILRQTVDEYYGDLISSLWARGQDRLRTVTGRKGILPAEIESTKQRLLRQSAVGDGIRLTADVRREIINLSKQAASEILRELGLETYNLIAAASGGMELISTDISDISDGICRLIRAIDVVKPELDHYSRLTAEGIHARESAKKTLAKFDDLCSKTPHSKGLMDTFRKSILTQDKPELFIKSEAKRLKDKQRQLEEKLSFPRLDPAKRSEAENLLKTVIKRQGSVRFWQSALEAEHAKRVLGMDGSESESALSRLSISGNDAKKLLSIRTSAAAFDIIRWLQRTADLSAEAYPQLNRRGRLYAMLCAAFEAFGKMNYPDLMLCIDEAQDIGPEELRLIREVNGGRTRMNLYGDVNQLLNRSAGTADWSLLNDIGNFDRYELNEDYRNTAEIIDYCNDAFGYGMKNIGIAGAPVRKTDIRSLADELDMELIGSRRIAVIAKCSFSAFKKKLGREPNVKINAGELVPGEIAFLSPLESKGLEFESCYVLPQGMNTAERYVACTRALSELTIVK